MAYMTPEERVLVDAHIRAERMNTGTGGPPLPVGWRRRIPTLFSRYASKPFAQRHIEFWDWEDAIEVGVRPRPYIAIWGRGGGKSTTGEIAVTDIGVRGIRRYGWYVRGVQDKADQSVGNVGTLLESREVSKYFPKHARRMVNKYGSARAWRRNRLWTAGHFALDALGLDVASRGAKLDEDRPSFAVFDDIDDLNDSPEVTARKMATITQSILPALTDDAVVIFIQNLIKKNSIAHRLVKDADFLADRIVSGPHPAVEGFKYEWQFDAKLGRSLPIIIAGRATWEGQDLATCQRQLITWGPSSFEKEAQHEVLRRAHGVVLRFDRDRHVIADPAQQGELGAAATDSLSLAAIRQRVRGAKLFGGVDPQWYRFGFMLFMVEPNGDVTAIGEVFSQTESLAKRAKRIHEAVLRVLPEGEEPSAHRVRLWADAANPQDIAELNAAFKKGWPELDDAGKPLVIDGEVAWVTSRLRVVAVAGENKVRGVAVMRLNDMLDASQLRVWEGLIQPGATWQLGMNADSEGVLQEGSRFVYEVENWAITAPKEGDAQDESPDDDTADGADCIAAGRYAIMSQWRGAKFPDTTEDEVVESDRVRQFDTKRREFVEPPHMVDVFEETRRAAPGRPSVSSHRPRFKPF